jgi:hypothetical protein
LFTQERCDILAVFMKDRLFRRQTAALFESPYRTATVCGFCQFCNVGIESLGQSYYYHSLPFTTLTSLLFSNSRFSHSLVYLNSLWLFLDVG